MPKALKTENQVKSDLAAENAREQMVAFYDRRHPGYNDLITHWEFLEQSYRGGRAWFQSQIFKYHKEGEKEFADRLNRAYRFNHTREVVELLQKYLFKGKITRSLDAPEQIAKFWNKATKTGLNIDQFMRQVSVGNSIGGRVAVVVDNNFASEVTVGGKKRPMSQSELEASNSRVYAYMVPTKHILDYAWDEEGDGELLWIKLREVVRDDADPVHSTGEFVNRVRLWTRQNWFIYEEVEEKASGGQAARRNIKLVGQGAHGLGFVPVRLCDHTVAEDPYRVPALIDDIAYLDRAVANYLSSLDAIIQDQTFSQLAIPAQALQQGDDMFNKVLEMGTKRIFVYDAGTSSAKPEFLSPDPKQAGVILSVINKVINEIYHTIGLAGERTKEDNAVGIDNSSGVAKAYDFERVNSLLLSKGQACEGVENWIVTTALAWHKKPAPADPLVTYPTNFDVMRLVDDLVTAEALAKLAAPIEVRRQQMRQTVDKMMPQLPSDAASKINKSVDEWLEGTDVILPPTSLAPNPGQKPAASPKRQGSVTADTK
jgi:hypothetical protein